MTAHGYVPIRVIGLLPNGATGHTTVNAHADRYGDGKVALFTPMIREVAERQLGLEWGQHFQGFTWYPIGDFVDE